MAATKAFSIILLLGLILLSTAPESVLSTHGKCPKDTMKFGVCGSFPLLGGVVGVGSVLPCSECCSLVKGLCDLDAATCLCSAMKANVLGVIKVDMSVGVSELLHGCGKKMPHGFTCA